MVIYKTVGPTLAASLEPFTVCRNLASLSHFYRCYFGRSSFKQAELVLLPLSPDRCTLYFDRLHDFSVTSPRCYMDVYVNSFFPHTARHRLLAKCIFLTYDLMALSLELKDTFFIFSFFLDNSPVCI